MKIGIALSGGSLKGASHIGALQALAEQGLVPSYISGTSSGSIVAGLYAAGLSLEEIKKFFFAMDWKMFDIDYRGIIVSLLTWPVLGEKRWTIDGIVKGERIERIFRSLTKGKKMQETIIPLSIPAVDINSAKTVMFTSDATLTSDDPMLIMNSEVRISEAIRSSIAFPFIFQPKLLGNNPQLRLVDGGVKLNVPSGILYKMGAEKIIALNLGYNGQLEEGVNDILEITHQSLDIMMYELTRLRGKIENVFEIRRSNARSWRSSNISRSIVIFNPEIDDIRIYDFNRMRECVERGYDSMREVLPEIKEILQI